MSRLLSWLFLFLMVALATPGARGKGANGALRGNILDADFSVPVSGAFIALEGTNFGGVTDAEGSFFINDIPAGRYSILASKDGFIRERRADLIVAPGSVKEVSFDMTAEVVELDEFVVAEEEIVDSTSSTISVDIRRDLTTFTEVLGQQFIAQTGASNAANLLAKTTGVNVSDGKFVVVRGLADRYNSVTLNSLRVPSSDPDRRAVALDLFPSAVIRDVRTTKTFTPDQPGESTGATIDVKTKAVPEEDYVKLKFGSAYNSQATGNPNFLSYRGGGTGMFGNARDRALPGFIRDAALPEFFAPSAADSALRQRVNEALSTEMGTKNKTPPMDQTLEASLGRRFDFMGLQAGITISGDYSKKFTFSDQDGLGRYAFDNNGNILGINRLVVPGSQIPGGIPAGTTNFPWGQKVSAETMRAGLLVSFGIELDTDSELTFTYFFNRVAEDRTNLQFGYNPQTDPTVARYRESIAYAERQLQTWQIAGSHLVDGSGADFKVDWGIGYSNSYQYEPDLRVMYTEYDIGAGSFTVPTQNEPPFARYWRNIDDESYTAKVDIETDLFGDSLADGLKAKLKFGGLLDYSDRSYRGDSFEYNAGSTNNNFPFNHPQFRPGLVPGTTWGDLFLIGIPNINNGGIIGSTYLHRLAEQPESYDASQMISAGYMMMDVNLTPAISLTFGGRVETTDMNVQASPVWNYDNPTVRYALVPPSIRFDRSRAAEFQALQILIDDAFGGSVAARNDPRIAALARAQIQRVDFLPSFSATWDVKENQRLRFSISQTMARPSFKEISPVAFVDPFSGDFFIGNRELKTSSITNYDVRWECFPEPGSVLGVSAFAKSIKNPIEYSQVGNFIQYVNVDEAQVYGFELEYQRDLSFLHDGLKPFNIGTNYSYIYSQARRPEYAGSRNVFGNTRRLQGQPDYIYNFNFTYDNKETGWFFGTFLNVTGQQLFAVSAAPNEPDIFQEPYTTLDIGIAKDLWKGSKLTFRAANVTNQGLRRFYNNAEKPLHSSRYPGINYSLSLSFNW